MATESNPLAKLQGYTAKVKETDYALDYEEPGEDYGLRVNKTLRSLQNQIKQNEIALEKLRASVRPPVAIDEPSQDPTIHLAQLRVVTTAYKSLALTKPLLPQSDSPLPALLALRSTLNVVNQSKASINKTLKDITEARAKLRREEDNLKDARGTTQALEKRIVVLTIENESRSQSGPEELAKAMIQEEKRKRTNYVTDLKKLVKAFNTFVDEHLAAMIAAEDVGGPVVGDMVNVDEDALKAGFNRQSKAKSKTDNDTIEAKRRRRNEEMWGSGDEDSDHEQRSERGAAGADFRSLTEDLLNASAGDESSDPYIKIRRESAAVRFLVRAKVAQFHPDDARQLRLVDFGKELGE